MRLNMPREFYIPKNATPLADTGTDAVIYVYEANGKPYALGFHGKANKPDFHYSYRTVESRAEAIARYIEGRKQTAQLKAETKTKRMQPHTLKIGDILDSSWGYDQTNVDYYQVTRIVGPHTVELREICAESVQDSGYRHGMADRCLPVRDAFKSEPFTKRTSYQNSVSISSYRHASLWDGKDNYRSWYA